MRRLFFWFSSSFNFPRSSFLFFRILATNFFFSLHLLPIFASPAQKNRNNGHSIFWKDFCGKHNFSPVTEVFFFIFLFLIYLVHFIPPCCRFQWKSASASWSVSHRKEMLIIWSLTDLLYISLRPNDWWNTKDLLLSFSSKTVFHLLSYFTLKRNRRSLLQLNKQIQWWALLLLHPSIINFFRFVQLVCHFLFTSFSFSFTAPIGFFF
jgi:hypothetical protein